MGYILNSSTRFKKGHKVSEEVRRKISLANMGNKSWTGKHRSEETKQKLRLANKGKFTGKDSMFWKGDNVGKRALHIWVRKNIPIPEECQSCGQKKKLQAANITGIYNREPKNWNYLCAKCHVYLDGTVYNLVTMRDRKP